MSESLIDLHAHTTASDGSLSPTELVEAAHATGLAAIGVTDHDTIDGVAEAVDAGAEVGIRVVPGVEISAELDGGSLHVLGYGYDHADPGINDGLDRLKQARDDRNPRILQKLRELGVPITEELVMDRAGGGVVGRPHIAQVLVDLKAVDTVQQAFDDYLATGAAAHVDKFRLDPEGAFALIRDAGGIPVMAHPFQTRRMGDDLRRLVEGLRTVGLEGIEVWYSRHTPDQTEAYAALAEEFDLVATGGTDFHGESKPDIRLGVGTGDLAVPATVLDAIDARVAAVRASGQRPATPDAGRSPD